MLRLVIVAFLSVATAATMAATIAESAAVPELPLWEAGLGIGVLSLPDYRGSDQSRLYALPLPYLVYRGAIFKADREGARAELFDNDRIKLELSVNASVPVSSKKNRAREGMPNLNGSFEIGPALNVNLYRSDDRRFKLDFRIPAVFGISPGASSQRSLGWQAAPRLNLDVRDFGAARFGPGWNLGMLAGPIFATRQRNAYFYDVAPQYATPTRSAYRSAGGYAGTEFIAALSKRFPDYWVGAFVRYDTLSGATFENSPLVRKKNYLAAGIGVAWVLGQSGRRVPVDE